MANLLTVPFQYREQTYQAVVSFSQNDGAQTVTIHLPDESLHPILQGSTFSFDAQKGLPIDYPTFTPAQELLVSILAAIDRRNRQLETGTNKSQSL